jgi:hypothetical protein
MFSKVGDPLKRICHRNLLPAIAVVIFARRAPGVTLIAASMNVSSVEGFLADERTSLRSRPSPVTGRGPAPGRFSVPAQQPQPERCQRASISAISL